MRPHSHSLILSTRRQRSSSRGNRSKTGCAWLEPEPLHVFLIFQNRSFIRQPHLLWRLSKHRSRTVNSIGFSLASFLLREHINSRFLNCWYDRIICMLLIVPEWIMLHLGLTRAHHAPKGLSRVAALGWHLLTSVRDKTRYNMSWCLQSTASCVVATGGDNWPYARGLIVTTHRPS